MASSISSRSAASPETVFDLAGVYSLKMRVAGVLAPTQSPDDLAVFVDLKTVWVIQGLVHGHADLTTVTDPTLVMGRSDGRVTATAKLAQYTEITPENIDSFHFHGSPTDYTDHLDHRPAARQEGRSAPARALHRCRRD